MERFDDICPENEFEDKNYNEEYDALTDGMYGDMPSNPLEYDAMMDAMGF